MSIALSLALGVVPYLGLLFHKAATPLPPVPPVSWSIQQIYAVHLLSALHIAWGWMVLSGLHAWAVLVWRSRREKSALTATVPPSPTASVS